MTADSETASPQQAVPQARLKPKRTPKPRPDHCLNCGTPAAGKFCAACGQEIKDHSVSLGPLLAEGLAELASWDSKMFRTLVPLVIRPGFLTNEYLAGHRVPYLSPLKLYLTLSVLFFLLLSWTHPVRVDIGNNLQMQLGGVPMGQDPSGRAQTLPRTAAEYDAQQKALPAAQRDIPFQQWMARHAYKAKQSPQGFVSALVSDIPKMLFFLLPLFAAFLKLLYLRTKRLYLEHLIFLLHVHAFAFAAFLPLLLIHSGWLIVAMFLVLPVYILAAQRVVYKQGWIKTVVKFSLLGSGYVCLLSLCFVGTMLAALWLL